MKTTHGRLTHIAALALLGWIAFFAYTEVFAPSGAPLPAPVPRGLVDADGRAVTLEAFGGGHLWIDYAAPWCSPCIPQAREIALLDRQLAGRVTFVTVLTSEEVMQAATLDTARSWAERFGLERSRVLVGDNPALTVPLHVLKGPDGRTLHRSTGGMNGAAIRGILEANGAL